MIYLWREPKNSTNRNTGEYDREHSPDRFLLREGRILSIDEFTPMPHVIFEITKQQVLKFDVLTNNSGIPLVNNRIKLVLQEMASESVQFFPAKLLCKDGEIDDYYYLNVTQSVTGIDHEKSVYTKIKDTDAILGFTYLTYKPGCMGGLHIARDAEYHSSLLVDDEIKTRFDKEGFTGLWLVTPEYYYQYVSQLI